MKPEGPKASPGTTATSTSSRIRSASSPDVLATRPRNARGDARHRRSAGNGTNRGRPRARSRVQVQQVRRKASAFFLRHIHQRLWTHRTREVQVQVQVRLGERGQRSSPKGSRRWNGKRRLARNRGRPYQCFSSHRSRSRRIISFSGSFKTSW